MVGVTLAERYVLVEKLATGGMGSVYVATDTRLERRVAVKLMKDGLASDPRFVERFRREARAAGALSHPNVAGVFDYGEDQDRHYIVMELVQGRDLARLLREEGPLSEERATVIGAQIAEALGHAHAAGVVHRDIKPANVIVGSSDRVKVTDFGIARAQTDTALTATGSLLGTAQYISPEQASGAEVAPSSDIYSLGIVLFEMITGSVPFTGDSAVAVAMRHVSDRVPAPSTLRPEISEAMDGVIKTATARDPHDRYPDATTFAEALRDPAGSGAASASQAATGVLSPSGAASTAVLSGTATREFTGEQWPFPGHPPRWNPRTLGRVVLAIFAVLLLIAVALVTYRLAERGDARRAQQRSGTLNEARQTTEVEPEEQLSELPVLEGLTYESAVAELDALGISSRRSDASNTEYEPGLVFATTPAAGAEVPEGETVTLYVSTGPAEEESDDDDRPPGQDEDFVPPGRANKDKGRGDDD